MNIILLSGGSGKRLWPLSNDTRSKQFLKLLKNTSGEFESMVQRIYGQIQKAGIEANIVIATGKSQIDSIRSQLGAAVDIVLEPERRDTFPAIALSSAYLALEKNMSPEDVILVLPVDPYVSVEYFMNLSEMEKEVKKGIYDIVLMGVKPTYPSEKYGYIVPEANGNIGNNFIVERFTEKPNSERAKELIEEGAFWNSGVFAFKLGFLMNIVKQQLEFKSFEELNRNYAQLKKISFDYEVVEKASSIAMVPYNGEWKDLGTWNTLTEEMDGNYLGCATIDEESVDTHIINELDIPVIALGVKDLVIVASHDGILVSDKEASARLKSYVENLDQRPMYEERQWGNYKVLDFTTYEDGTSSLTRSLFIWAGKSISYHYHTNKDEIWTVVNGSGELVENGHVRNVRIGEVIYINKGTVHSIKADTNLRIIEVQIGKELFDTDIEY